MDQRRLKVGDIVDDYCPRERRVTDHAIVAIVDDTVRQTRCTACDNEHPYKEARLPRPRRKAVPAAAAAPVVVEEALVAPVDDEPATAPEGAEIDNIPAPPTSDEGPVHRPLIRATLPRPEGSTPAARQMPEFTIRQATGRGRFRDDFRGGFRAGGGGNNGNRQGHGRPGRPGGSQQSRPRHGRPAPHKKRSR